MDRCKFHEGDATGSNLDPCEYEEIERYVNVTIVVSKCKNCGHIDISWLRQDNTEVIESDRE